MNTRSLLVLAFLTTIAPAEAHSPPQPRPWVWVSAGGAVGESATVQVAYSTASRPYAVLGSLGLTSGSPFPLAPPFSVLAAGTLTSSGTASFLQPVPGAPVQLIGTSVHLAGLVHDPGQGGWIVSSVCTWVIAPNGPRRFVATGARIPHTLDGSARALLNDGTVLVTGGGGSSGPPFNAAEVYDPVRKTSVRVGNMTTARTGHVAETLSDGTVLVVGGDPGPSTSTAELYNPQTRQFQSLGAVPHYLYRPMAVKINDPLTGRLYVLIAGGWSNGVTASAMLYDASSRTFRALPPMGRPRALAAAAALPIFGAVLITGGVDPAWQSGADAEVFVLATGRFYAWGSMARPRHNHAMIALDATHLLILGGGAGSDQRDLELFSAVARRSWRLPLQLHRPRAAIHPVVLADGSILVAGGEALPSGDFRRTPEILTASGSTLLRPIPEMSGSLVLQGTASGGAIAIGAAGVYDLQ